MRSSMCIAGVVEKTRRKDGTGATCEKNGWELSKVAKFIGH